MDYDRLSTYLCSLETEYIEQINDIEAYAEEHNIPIAKRETVSFLQTMITLTKPARILEVGTCIAYSTIIMAMAAGDKARVTSIEIGENDYNIAATNVKKCVADGLIKEGQINLIKGDATSILPTLTDEYDLIFMDAAKGQYITWLPQIVRLLKKGGALISDNVLLEETLLESKFSLERRQRTIHKRMREYLYELKHREDLQTSIMPLGDGVAITVKK